MCLRLELGCIYNFNVCTTHYMLLVTHFNPDDKFSMSALRRLDLAGEFNLFFSLSNNLNNFTNALGIPGSSALKSADDVFTHWLRKPRVHNPPTLRSLLHALEELGLGKLSLQIKKRLHGKLNSAHKCVQFVIYGSLC